MRVWAVAPEEVDEGVPSTSQDTRPMVLVCDDEPDVVEIVGAMLEHHGYRVTSVASGYAALHQASRDQPAAIVLDLIMPEMTGLDVLRAARTEERLAEVRFIVLSAMYMTKNERQVLGPRVADVVRKGETMPRALTFALHRAVEPVRVEPHAHPDEGGRHL